MKLRIILIMLLLFWISTASANPDIEIKPDSNNGNTITVTVSSNQDVYQTSGLEAIYHKGYGQPYSVKVERDGAKLDDPPEWEEEGDLPGDDQNPGNDHEVKVHWKPKETHNGCKEEHTLHVKGGDDEKHWRIKTCKPGPPVPELPASALVSIGLMGLVGLMRVKGKDKF